MHFNWPDNWIGSDPKTQYGTAASGIATKYSVTLATSPSPALGEIAKPDEKVTIANWTNFHRLKRTDKIGFEIYGTKIPRDVKVWLVAYVPDQEYEVPNVSVFTSEENAIDSIVEIEEDGLRRTMERLIYLWQEDSANEDLYGDGDVERETFEVWLKNSGYAHMESEKEARAFVKKHGYYGMIPDLATRERAVYQLSFTILVKEVTLM